MAGSRASGRKQHGSRKTAAGQRATRALREHLPSWAEEHERLRERLAKLPLFKDASARTLRSLESEMDWMSVPGGWMLLRSGEPGQELYIVLSGALAVLDADDSGRIAVRVGPGETAGEMSFITGDPRRNSVIALRDTEVLRLTREAYHRLVAELPGFTQHMTEGLVRRLHRLMEGRAPAAPPRTVAVVPLSQDAPADWLVGELRRRAQRQKRQVLRLSDADAHRPTDWFHDQEAENDLLLYECGLDNARWTRLAMRQADLILLVTAAESEAEIDRATLTAVERIGARDAVMVSIEPAGARRPLPVPHWSDHLDLRAIWRARPDRPDDLDRLYRLVTQQAVALAFSAGGARGFAHIGVIQALREAGIPIDMVCGTSMGAVIAATVALEWSDREIRRRLRNAFVRGRPFSDVTVPVVSLVRGRKVTEMLREHFGDARIEGTWLPYFCVSTNLTTGRVVTHDDGPLWQALRATVSIPGILSPVVRAGELLVDGGVMNGLPIDILADRRPGYVIGVDVASARSLSSAERNLEKHPSIGLISQAGKEVPSIFNILARAGAVNSAAQLRQVANLADIMLRPDVGHVDMLEWKSFDDAVDCGYRHTKAAIEAGMFDDLRSSLSREALTA